jgi:hypothetical protein
MVHEELFTRMLKRDDIVDLRETKLFALLSPDRSPSLFPKTSLTGNPENRSRTGGEMISPQWIIRDGERSLKTVTALMIIRMSSCVSETMPTRVFIKRP